MRACYPRGVSMPLCINISSNKGEKARNSLVYVRGPIPIVSLYLVLVIKN